MTRLIGFWAAVLTLSLCVSGTGQDRFEKLIEMLKKKGITFTTEELAELERTPVTEAGGAEQQEIERAIDRALDEREDAFMRLRVPGVKSLTISGENRLRGEIQRSIYGPGNVNGRRDFDFVRMRNRLRFDAEVNDHIEATVEIQDVRFFGQSGSTVGVNAFSPAGFPVYNATGVDLKRGAVVLKDLFDMPLRAEAGRFVMAYGDHRLIGDLEWFDQGRSYDGARLSVAEEGFFIDAFGAKVREGEVIVPDTDDVQFAGIYGGTRNEDGPINVEGYVIFFSNQADVAGERAADQTDFTTIGARIFGQADVLDYSLEAAYQNGSVRGDNHKAWAFAAAVGLNFPDAGMRPRIGLEIDHASGDDNPLDGDSGTFQTLFPTNHRHYGHADLLAWMNMWDIRVGASLQPSDELTIALDFHHLRLANPKGGWYNAGGALLRTGVTGDSRHLGNEIDLTLKWKPWKPLSILLGWAHLFEGGFIRDTGSGSDADLMYLQSHVRF